MEPLRLAGGAGCGGDRRDDPSARLDRAAASSGRRDRREPGPTGAVAAGRGSPDRPDPPRAGIRAGVGLAQELLTLREQGIPQSFPVTGIIVPAIAVAINLAIGHGLWRLRPWGRRLAIPWDALVAIVTALVAAWQWKYHASARLDQWPDYLVSDVLPWFLLVVMLLPGTRLLVRRAPPGGRRRWLSPVSLAALLLLIVVASTLVVDVADWVVRSWVAPLD